VPGAFRAVGTVMANNPVPLIVPCHRVVRNDGLTGGYAFGADKKARLLEAEGVSPEELQRAPTWRRRAPGSSAMTPAATPRGFARRTVGRSGRCAPPSRQATGLAGCVARSQP
jgi:hypothetical protein